MGNFIFKKKKEMSFNKILKNHNGEGFCFSTGVIESSESKFKKLNFIHDTVIPAGSSIGIHGHEDEEEYYYVISGKGTMILDGKVFEIKEGDVAGVFPGGTHGLKNDSEKDLRILVVSVAIK